jgi:hypothetical protein
LYFCQCVDDVIDADHPPGSLVLIDNGLADPWEMITAPDLIVLINIETAKDELDLH